MLLKLQLITKNLESFSFKNRYIFPQNVKIKTRFLHNCRAPFENLISVSNSSLICISSLNVQRKSLYFIVKRNMLNSVKNSNVASQVRTTVTKFVETFPTKQVLKKDLLDRTLIQNIGLLPQNNPAYLNRAFQLCLNVAFKQTVFSSSILTEQFHTNIVHSLDATERIKHVDHSSLHNSLVGKQLTMTHPKASITIYQAPQNINPEKLPPEYYNKVMDYKQITGNPFPDLSIDGIPFDMKITKNICNNKNHIYYMTLTDEAVGDVKKHLFDLIKRINTLQKRENYPYYKELKQQAAACHKILVEANSLSTKKEAIIKWELFTVKTISQRPDKFGLPIFHIPEQDLNLEEVPLNIDKCPPVPHGILEYNVIEKLLRTMIGNVSTEQSQAIHLATAGSLGHILKNIDQNPC